MGINDLFGFKINNEIEKNQIENTYDFETNNSNNKNKEDLLSNKEFY